MGFFERNRVEKPKCIICGLDKNCNTPRMNYSGKGKKKVLIITGVPSEKDDEAGKHITGEPGRFLAKRLMQGGLNIERDCWKLNAVNCRPCNSEGDSIQPSKKHVEYCKPYMTSIIKSLNPNKIILVGATACTSYFAGRVSGASITKYAGLKFWDSKYNCWVFPIPHPEWVMKQEHNYLLHAEYGRMCKNAALHTSEPKDVSSWRKEHKCMVTAKDCVSWLKNLLQNPEPIAFDYEATGLAAYAPGHKVLSVSICTSKEVVAMPLDHKHWSNSKDKKKIIKLWKKVLASDKISKIAHNLMFEYAWSRSIFGVEPKCMDWDTQLSVHILDNRKGILKLKFQSFMNWGIEKYDKQVEEFIKADHTGFNRMEQVPLDLLLEYNCEDAEYTYQLWHEHKQVMTKDDMRAYKLLHDGLLVLCEMHHNGIKMDVKFYKKQRKKLQNKLDKLYTKLYKFKEIKEFIARSKSHTFNPASPQDLNTLLFKQMGLKSIKKTAHDEDSTDEEVLNKIGIPLTSVIVKIRKLEKMISTYIDGFLKHTYDGRMHPLFSLALARSYRSSSRSPNFQNVPKRDEEGKKITRGGMVPSPGCVLIEADFSGAEIATSCCYHRDPTFINYQTSGKADMHTDAAANIWDADGLITKPIRQNTKAGFVFSQFYGSYYVSCAKQMWEEMREQTLSNGMKLIDHAINKGFGSYKEFENRVKKFEDKFWNEWFPVYTKWKKDVVANYEKTGKVTTFFGFTFRGVMNRKQCTNYPIQGTSFHLLLYTLAKVHKAMKKAKMKAKLIGQIHDSIIADVPLPELDKFKSIVGKIVRGLKEKLKWMCVPMDIDCEVSKPYEQGGNFAQMEESPI